MNSPESQNRPTHAFNAANAFFGLAGSFLKEVPSGLNESAQFIVTRLSQFEAAVTNLSLALELFLKGLALATNVRVTKTHDLLVLFDALPVSLKNSIAQNYTFRVKNAAPNLNTSVHLVITPTPTAPTEKQFEAIAKKIDVSDIRSVLDAERDAFRTWRYLYEAGDPNKLTLFISHYGYLGLVINSIQAHLKPKY
jgi:hypothetical protein